MISKSINQSGQKPHPIDRIDGYRELIKENISYETLSVEREELDEIVELMTDAITSTAETVRIGKEDKPTAVVASQLMKLDGRHVEYVVDCMRASTVKIKNIRAYLLTALYNAPSTMTSYYNAEAQHDLYGGDADV